MEEFSGDWSGDNSFTNDTLENASLSCIARSLQNVTFQPSFALATVMGTLQAVLCFLLMIFGGILNCLVLYLVCKYKKLQTPSFAIAVQVSVLNLLLSFLSCPVTVISITSSLFQTEVICSLLAYFFNTFIFLRVLLMLLLVIDRFLLVFSPFWYPEREVKVVTCASVLCWVLALVTFIPVVPGILDCLAIRSGLCSFDPTCGKHCLIYRVLFMIVFVPVTVIPVFFYGVLYYKAKKSGVGHVNQQQWKATATFSLIFLTLFVLTLPGYVISSILRSFLASSMPSLLLMVIVFIRMAASLLVITDPVFLLRNRDVREVLSSLKDRAKKKFTSKPSSPGDRNVIINAVLARCNNIN